LRIIAWSRSSLSRVTSIPDMDKETQLMDESQQKRVSLSEERAQ
jgi:hypothetical protein